MGGFEIFYGPVNWAFRPKLHKLLKLYIFSNNSRGVTLYDIEIDIFTLAQPAFQPIE